MRILLIPALILSLAVGGCATVDALRGVLSVSTASVANPVTRQQQAAVEATYQVVASSALSYSRLRRCKAGETASAVNLCSQWSIVQKLKNADNIAHTALVDLRKFMDNNQTINAISAYNQLQAAIADFKNIARTTGV